jgi:hypothetical protein
MSWKEIKHFQLNNQHVKYLKFLKKDEIYVVKYEGVIVNKICLRETR